MEFRQLEYFLAVAETLNFGKAAKKLNVSQPAISKQIKLLEEELETPLFDETQKIKHKRIILTEEGSYFLQEASKIVRAKKEALEGLHRLKSKQKTVTLGLYKSLPQKMLSKVLTLLSFSDFEVKLVEYNSVSDVEEAIENGEVLLGITLSLVKPQASILLEEGHMQLVLPSSHLLAEKTDVFLHQLKGQNLIHSDVNLNLIPNQSGLSSFELNLSIIESGHGVGAFPSFYSTGLMAKDLKVSIQKPSLIPCFQLLCYKAGTNPSIVQRLEKS